MGKSQQTWSSADAVVGLMVVRKRGLDVAPELSPLYFSHESPQVAGVYYGGWERMPWHDIATAAAERCLPSNLRQHWETIDAFPADGIGLKLCYDYSVACELAAIANRETERCELIAVRSPLLAQVKGFFAISGSGVEWQGFDPLATWSLLRQGLFTAPNLFPQCAAWLNLHGLLATTEQGWQFVDIYERVATESGQVDPALDTRYKFDVLEIGRVSPNVTA